MKTGQWMLEEYKKRSRVIRLKDGSLGFRRIRREELTDQKDEAPVVKRVMIRASKLGLRLLRNNRGLFQTLDGKRKVRAGLEAEGASDLIGIKTITVTEDMIGTELGVFLAVEVKKPKWKKPTTKIEKEQENFIAQIIKRGGIAFFINDAEDLERKIESFSPSGRFRVEILPPEGFSPELAKELTKCRLIKKD